MANPSGTKAYAYIVATAVAPCWFIDSTQFSKEGEWPTIDGQHLTLAGYKAWGADIAASLEQLAPQLPRHP